MIPQHPHPLQRPTFLPSAQATGETIYGPCRADGHDFYELRASGTEVLVYCGCKKCVLTWNPKMGWYEAPRA